MRGFGRGKQGNGGCGPQAAMAQDTREQRAEEGIAAQLLPLSCARAGEPVRLISVQAGKAVNRRLSDMGLPLGAVLEVVPTAPAGPMLVEHGGTRIALGRGLASKLMVQPAAAAEPAR